MSAFDLIKACITEGDSFVLEAGAGSGKTYTLIQTINHLVEVKGDRLKLDKQKIVCITYTNVAKNEIIERLENNPLVSVSTIHEYLWDCIKPYNRQLLVEFDGLNTEYHREKPDKFELGLIDRIRAVEYSDRKFSDFEEGKVGHDDLITLSLNIFKNYDLFTQIIAQKYPYILVDEYQDSAEDTIESLIDYLLERNKTNVVLGFFGDSYQKIYDTGVGSLKSYVDSGKIKLVTKSENYRCSQSVLDLLNKIRTNITQEIPEDRNVIEGSIRFINCANYPAKGADQKIREYENSLKPQKNSNYDNLIGQLENEGWNFGKKSDDKILIIANSRVAERGGFGNLYKVFATRFGQGASEALLKRENYFSSFFLGSTDKKTSTERETGVEHLVGFYRNLKYSSLMNFLKKNGKAGFQLKVHSDKSVITQKLDELIALRENSTVREVFEFTVNNGLVNTPKGMEGFLQRINVPNEQLDEEQLIRKRKDVKFHTDLMDLNYKEFINLFKHTQDESVFSTKHGTKGEEYRNVLVVIDDTSWKQNYNFQNFMNDSEENADRQLRTKNLFYVSCSRAKENLVVFSLSTMNESAMAKVESWFGDKVEVW